MVLVLVSSSQRWVQSLKTGRQDATFKLDPCAVQLPAISSRAFPGPQGLPRLAGHPGLPRMPHQPERGRQGGGGFP
eukprot:4315202-Alexandrium_andersonii.AAC.1